LILTNLYNKPVQLLTRENRINPIGLLTKSFSDDSVCVQPFEKDSEYNKHWPCVLNPLHLDLYEIVGCFELKNIPDETTTDRTGPITK